MKLPMKIVYTQTVGGIKYMVYISPEKIIII